MRLFRSLPPLLSLRAFEAAARHLSFSLAAAELFVTQSAVSHHIQKLEADLGVALFERRTRAVALTPEGEAYYANVHAAFELLRGGTEAIRAQAIGAATLTVGVLASFATRWLAPRLPAFSAAYPDITLQLRPEIALADVPAGAVDVAIRYGRGRWPATRARRLMAERLFPVCAPSLLAGGSRPRRPQDLARFPILASYSKNAFEWDCWARHVGLDLGAMQTVQLHDYNIVVEAALAGQGIAMGRQRLIAGQLETGALVPVLPDAVLDDDRIGWWLVSPKGTPKRAASAFCDWLVQAAEKDALDPMH
ncbi:transcriptional regulator GcvA [Achromobacter aloeverae]|uniref:LysR family transcriptional regulator n=1 Tax=Achromobacter aloeverae TaxID=1750518 RepID=A0A4Q1HFP5_9BURK|nr:transcriptional regulator GcvA [Achromobacter aloeverae]RXN85935.1 LysR family transcriptional regulator [Achromobacter aloeverae]